MKTISQEFENALEVIADENQVVTENELSSLSDMTDDEYEAFHEKWKTVDCIRRQQIITILHDEADDNTSYDFSRIFRLCLRDTDEDVRYEAVKSIWESRDTTFIPRLSKIACEDDSADVREAACEALGYFALMAELEDLSCSADIENILLSVYYNEHEFDSVKTEALVAVAPISSPGVLKAIEDAYRKDDDQYKIAAILAMGRNTEDIWIPIINNELENDENRDFRLAAVKAAGNIEDESFVPYLATIMIEKDDELIIEVIKALGNIGTNGAKRAVLTMENSENENIQNAIKEALENISNNLSPLSYEINLHSHQHLEN